MEWGRLCGMVRQKKLNKGTAAFVFDVAGIGKQ